MIVEDNEQEILRLSDELEDAKDIIFSTATTNLSTDILSLDHLKSDNNIDSFISGRMLSFLFDLWIEQINEQQSNEFSDLAILDPAITNTTEFPEQKDIKGIYLVKKEFIYVFLFFLFHNLATSRIIRYFRRIKENYFYSLSWYWSFESISLSYISSSKDYIRVHDYSIVLIIREEEEEIVDWDLPNTQQEDFMDLTVDKWMNE